MKKVEGIEMNKRQRKKLLCKAIRELNNDVAEELGEPKITDKEVLQFTTESKMIKVR